MDINQEKFLILCLGILLAMTIVSANHTATQNLIGILEEPISFLDLRVYSPQDSGIYSSRKIEFNLTTNNDSEIIEYINYEDNNPKFRRLCKDCDEYGFFRKKIKAVNEGMNNITFRAEDEFNNIDREDVVFFVDTKDPKITRTLPRRNTFANGLFSVEFIEANPVEVILYYGNDSEKLGIQNDCSVEREKYSCRTSVNLDSYDGEKIEYYFLVRDIVNQTDMSRTTLVKVDNSPPIINEFNFSLDSRFVFWHKNRVFFYFNVTESNFDEITYIDHEDRYPRERVLCSRLKEGICEKTKHFLRGQHNFTIYVKDKAGNSEIIEPVEFFINPQTF